MFYPRPTPRRSRQILIVSARNPHVRECGHDHDDPQPDRRAHNRDTERSNKDQQQRPRIQPSARPTQLRLPRRVARRKRTEPPHQYPCRCLAHHPGYRVHPQPDESVAAGHPFELYRQQRGEACASLWERQQRAVTASAFAGRWVLRRAPRRRRNSDRASSTCVDPVEPAASRRIGSAGEAAPPLSCCAVDVDHGGRSRTDGADTSRLMRAARAASAERAPIAAAETQPLVTGSCCFGHSRAMERPRASSSARRDAV